MTDVRLTATNPEDSSVVPVACNEKGELKLEEPPAIDDSNYVKVTGSNMTGDLTLGTDKITLDATDGSAEFKGANVVKFWDGRNNREMTIDNTATPGPLVDIKKSNNTAAFQIWNTGSSTTNPKLSITAGGNLYLGNAATFDDNNIALNSSDGSAEFAGTVTVSDGTSQSSISASGAPYFLRESLGAVAVNGFSTKGAFGLAIYDSVNVPNANSYKSYLYSDGSAEFAGDVVVGSRGTKWMIVESGGLAHLIEQSSFEVQPREGQPREGQLREGQPEKDYPKLRNIPNELTLVEQALEEVMEKLKMVPPAGWEVWDGSDENS